MTSRLSLTTYQVPKSNRYPKQACSPLQPHAFISSIQFANENEFPLHFSPLRNEKLNQTLAKKYQYLSQDIEKQIYQEKLSQKSKIHSLLNDLSTFTNTPNKVQLGKQVILIPETITPKKKLFHVWEEEQQQPSQPSVASRIRSHQDLFANAFLNSNSENMKEWNLMSASPSIDDLNRVSLVSMTPWIDNAQATSLTAENVSPSKASERNVAVKDLTTQKKYESPIKTGRMNPSTPRSNRRLDFDVSPTRRSPVRDISNFPVPSSTNRSMAATKYSTTHTPSKTDNVKTLTGLTNTLSKSPKVLRTTAKLKSNVLQSSLPNSPTPRTISSRSKLSSTVPAPATPHTPSRTTSQTLASTTPVTPKSGKKSATKPFR